MASASLSTPDRAQRRQNILAAAILVMARDGVEALSHRRVAKVAAVPVTATTYDFASLEELRAAALEEMVRQDVAALRRRLDSAPPGGVADALADHVRARLTDRPMAIVGVEVFASAMRRDSVRAVAMDWEESLVEALEPRIGRDRGLAAACAVFGSLQYALHDADDDVLEDLTAVMRQVVGDK